MKKIYVFTIALFLVNGAMAQWVPQNQEMFDTLNSNWLSSVYFTDVNTGYATCGTVYDTFNILKTTDGGSNWLYLPTPEQYWGYKIFFTNADTGYVDGCWRTTDGGATWTLQNCSGFYGINDIYFTDKDTGYVVGGGPTTSGPYSTRYIGKTIDGGENWITLVDSTIFATSDIGLYSVYFVNANTGYAVGGNLTILKTTDGGTNWVELTSGTGWSWASWNSVFFPATDTGYVVGYDGAIWKTTNGGIEWVAQSSGTSYSLSSVFFTDINTGYTVGSDGLNIILKTNDGGENWIAQSIEGIGNSYSLNSVFFPVADTGFIVGDGCILKTTNGGGFPVGSNEQIKNDRSLFIYPNPASTNITIKTPAKGSLSVRNTSGQQLLQQEITEPATTIEVSGWQSGVYVVKVVGEKGVSVGKFVKQ